MNKTSLLALIIAILAGFYFLVMYDTKSTSMDKEATQFSLPDTASISRIELRKMIKEKEAEMIVLEREEVGFWTVNTKYPAQQNKIRQLLKVVTSLQVEEVLTDEGQQLALQRMKKNHIKVDIYDEKKLLKAFYIGSPNKEYSGNYMLLEGYKDPFIMSHPGLNGYISIYFNTALDTWRENLLFNLPPENIQEISVAYLSGIGSFTLSRGTKTENWQLDGHPTSLNTANLEAYLAHFRQKQLGESFANETYPSMMYELSQKDPDIVFTIKDWNGSVQEMRIFNRPENKNNFFAYFAGSDEMLTVQHFVMDKFLVHKDFFTQPIP